MSTPLEVHWRHSTTRLSPLHALITVCRLPPSLRSCIGYARKHKIQQQKCSLSFMTFCTFKINASWWQATCSARNRSSVRVLCAGLLGTGVILTVWRRAVHWCVALAQPSRTWRALRTHVLLSCAERRITLTEGGFKPFCATCRNPDSFESPCDSGYLGRYPTSCGSPRSGLGITDMELREMLIKKS